MQPCAFLPLACITVLFALAGCTSAPDAETKPKGNNVLDTQALQAAKTGPVSFGLHVRPVLESKCVMCHNHTTNKGHISLESRKEAVRTGALGTVIVPGHPEHSLFVTNIKTAHQHVTVMPVVGERLTTEETELLTKWIKEGASWPAGAAGTLKLDR